MLLLLLLQAGAWQLLLPLPLLLRRRPLQAAWELVLLLLEGSWQLLLPLLQDCAWELLLLAQDCAWELLLLQDCA